MKADFIPNGPNYRAGARPLRRSNSALNLIGNRVSRGGAAERVAQRQLQRGRSRTNSRNRMPIAVNRMQAQNNNGRFRSRSRNRADNIMRANNNNNNANANAPNMRRSRSRSRGVRTNNGVLPKSAVPIRARLGLRPGGVNQQQQQRGRPRNASMTRQGVAAGRIQKRRNSNMGAIAGRNNQNGLADNCGRMGRARQRSVIRSQQRSRQRSRQRNNNGNIRGARSGISNQQQPRRGRSGILGGAQHVRDAIGIKAENDQVKREELDRELEQYMSNSLRETNYLLKQTFI